MRRTMHYMVAMAAALWMALPQVKAQTVEKDYDPGIMYLFSNEGKNIAFEEGNEWEILFTSTDTLGNEYASPVGMTLKGGAHGDSSYIYLQTVDSILMYQPEPQMQKGVFVITRDYFPYIAAVDSFTTIHFDNSLPYDLPEVGQKVVCNVYEEPLRNGFIGTVLKKDSKDGQLVMECDPYIDDIKDFYSYFLYSGSGGYTEEEQQAVERISKANRVRRGVVARAADKAENGNSVWEGPKLDFDLSLSSNLIDYKHFVMGGTYGMKGQVKVGVTMFPAFLGIQLPGVNINLDATAQGKFQIEGIAGDLYPIGKYGKTINEDFPMNTQVKLGVGFFVDVEGKMNFSVTSDPQTVKGSYTLRWDNENNEYVAESSGEFNPMKNPVKEFSGSINGHVDLRVGVSGELKALGGKVESTVAGYVSGGNFGGQIDLVGVFGGKNPDTPAALFDNYKDAIEKNHLYRKSALVHEFKIGLKVLDTATPVKFDLSKNLVLGEIAYNLLPRSNSSFELKKPLKSNCKLKVNLTNDGYSVIPSTVYIWAYNEDRKYWAERKKLGEIGSLNDCLFNFTKELELEPGYNYSICSVYKLHNTDVYVSDVYLDKSTVFQDERVIPQYVVKDLFIPYNIQMERPVIDNFNTIKLEATCPDEYMELEGATCGFVVEKQSGETIEIPVDMVVGGRFEAEMEVTSMDFSVMAYMDVEGKRRSYSGMHELKGLDLFTPIMIDPTDIGFSQARLGMKLSMLYDEEATWNGYFECWEKGNKENTLKKIPVLYSDVKDGIATAVVSGLTPRKEYVVSAVLNYGGLEYEPLETVTFMTAAPLKDLGAEPSFTSAILTVTLAENFGLSSDIYFYVNDKPDMKNPLKSHKVLNGECEVLGKELRATHELTDLKVNGEYYFKAVVKTEEGDEFESEVMSFKLLNPFVVELGETAAKSRTATLRATVSDYVYEKAEEDGSYTLRFYYGKSQSGVKNGQCDYIDVDINDRLVEARIEGLQKENKYYYKAAINDNGSYKNKSEIASFTTPNPYDVSTLNAEVEDATVTLKGKMTLEAYDEFLSDEHNTIIAGFEYSTSREALSAGKQEQVTRIREVELDKGASSVTYQAIVDLEPGTIYYYRAFIYVDGEEFPASIKTFQTMEYDGGLIPLAKKKR